MTEIRENEIDLTFRIRSQGSSSAGTVAGFRWGPVNKPVHISGGVEHLIQTFLEPKSNTGDLSEPGFDGFLAVENFLLYSNSIYVVRAEGPAALNAVSSGGVADLLDSNITNPAIIDTQFSDASFVARYPGSAGNSLKVSIADSTGYSGWAYENYFELAPGTGEFHLVVVDADGAISGTAGTVLEKHAHLSTSENAKKYDGSSAYYKTNLVYGSNWIVSGGLSFVLVEGVYEGTFAGGASDMQNADWDTSWDKLANKQEVDLSFLFISDLSTPAAIIQNVIDIADTRQDCVAFYSPVQAGISASNANAAATEAAVIDFRNVEINKNSSYAHCDSAGVKISYNKYNDREAYIPVCSDVAGLYAQSFNRNRPWDSAAGHNRGQIKNIIRLPYNPSEASRVNLRKYSINPIVSFPGEGTFLYGDKTSLSAPSAFRDMNVRFLFIVLRKNIARAARYQLFEFNDEVTRSLFRSATNAYLAEVEADRGLQRKGYFVKCDAENNTPQVIDTNGFVASIFLKPSRTINNIELNFVATPTGVDFKEIESAVG